MKKEKWAEDYPDPEKYKKVKEKILFYSEKILTQFQPKVEADYFFCEALKNMIFL